MKLPHIQVEDTYTAGQRSATIVKLYPEEEEPVLLYRALDERDAWLFRAQLLVGYGRLPVDRL